MSMPELLLTLEAIRDRREIDWQFNAAIQGIEWEPEPKSSKSFDEVQRRARIKAAGGNPEVNDIVNIQGQLAHEEGFGIGNGLGYEQV